MNEFYRYTSDDFISVSIADVRVGDELTWGMDSPNRKHGACVITDITDPAHFPGVPGGRLLTFLVVPGMNVHNKEKLNLSVEWEGSTPIITGTYWAEEHSTVLIRPRKDAE